MKIIILSLIGFIFALSAAIAVNHFWRGEVLSPEKVERRWGKADFETSKFKSGSEEVRAAMAASILKNKKQFMGKDSMQIRKELGDFDGFYFRDTFPTYIIYTGRDKSEDTWQLVFLLDNQFKVANIIVHKNCCN